MAHIIWCLDPTCSSNAKEGLKHFHLVCAVAFISASVDREGGISTCNLVVVSAQGRKNFKLSTKILTANDKTLNTYLIKILIKHKLINVVASSKKQAAANE